MSKPEAGRQPARVADDGNRSSIQRTLERLLPPATMLTVGVGLSLSPTADAAIFTVSTLADGGAGSLRQALIDSNLAAGPDSVVFQAGLTGTITLTTGQLDLYDPVDVQGPGPAVITVSGNNASRVFYLYEGKTPPNAITISGLTITGGVSAGGSGVVNFGDLLTLSNVVVTGNTGINVGGGVATTYGGTLTLLNSTISGNNTPGAGGGVFLYDPQAATLIQNSRITGNSAGQFGGGVFLYGGLALDVETSTISGNQTGAPPDVRLGKGLEGGSGIGGVALQGPLTITRSTLSGNVANGGDGGAMFLYGSAQAVTIENSTVSGNTASLNAGGIYLYNVADTSEFRHTTIVGNGSGALGGGVLLFGGDLGIDHVIAANNTDDGGASDLEGGQGESFDTSFSLVETNGPNITDLGGNVFAVDPQLGVLADNGGPTLTHLPGAMSPALNAGDATFVPPPTIEQRGLARVAGGRIEIGSVEIVPAGPGSTLTLTPDSLTVSEATGFAVLTVTRGGSTFGAVSVQYATADGSAVNPADYVTTSGPLTWADGDGTPRTISVPIVDDAVPELQESFTVTLSNAQGATIAGTGISGVIIVDNDVSIPTLSRWGQALIAGLLAVLGLGWLRRRRPGAAAALLAAALAAGASTPSAQAAGAKLAPEVFDGQVASVQRSGAIYTLRLVDGRTLVIDDSQLRFNDWRLRATAPFASLEQVTADSRVRVTIRRDDAGAVRRVRVAVLPRRRD